MATPSVTLFAPARTAVAVGGTSVVAIYGPSLGGRIRNPSTPESQGTAVVEPLYVSLTGPAALGGGSETFTIEPGQDFFLPPGSIGNVSVNAATSGHKFAGYVIQPFVPFVPASGGFPPPGPTTVTKTIPSYLYEQYDDDEDLQAFVDWYNGEAGEYVSWFATVNLGLWTGLSGDLLDWIGAGLYGYPRPVLPSGSNKNIGPLNTYAPNVLAPNQLKLIGDQNLYATTDDVYKRCLTWQLWKGDGKVATVKWLKRRVVRFLTGTEGGPGATDDTSPVSVTFAGDQVNIGIGVGTRTVVGGAIPNVAVLNAVALNSLKTIFIPGSTAPLAPIFKAAVDAGVLDLPFQFTYVVTVG